MVSTLSKPLLHRAIATEVVDYVTHQAIIHSVRQSVFVFEQSIPADLEIDQHDFTSKHVLACWEGMAVGTGRLTPDGQIGRVAVIRPFRRRGVGRCMMEVLLQVATQQRHPEVMLAAQCHAIPFYERLGFRQQGTVFQKLGIAHVMMYKRLA